MKKPDHPNDLNLHTILMCAPFHSSFNNVIKNNALMKDSVVINYNNAFKQWLKLYSFISSRGLVYVLPNEGTFQDQIYVANLGLVLFNRPNTVILSNYTSGPRQGEEWVGRTFFNQMKYNCYHSKFKFEGEADLKYISGNTYIGGYGIRTDIRTYKWLQDEFGCRIIPIHMHDQKLYHWDCCFFVIDKENALVNTSVLDDFDIRLIEKEINVIDVPKEFRYTGITNMINLGSILLCRKMPEKPTKWLTQTCNQLGYEVEYFDLDSQDANGADASCMVMNMNYVRSNKQTLVKADVRKFFRGENNEYF